MDHYPKIIMLDEKLKSPKLLQIAWRALDAVRKSKSTGLHASYAVTSEEMEIIAASLVNRLYGYYTPADMFNKKQKTEQDGIYGLLDVLEQLYQKIW